MLFIAIRSDSKDGAVPPEPVGPMDVAGCECHHDPRPRMFIDCFNVYPVTGKIHRR